METIDKLIARWRAKNTARKSLDDEISALAELILQELRDGEKRGGVQCVAQRRFSATLAKEMLTSADYDRICEQKPSAAKAERLLGTEIVDLCREDGPRFLRRADE